MTVLAPLRHGRITASSFIEVPINGETFRLYVEKVLVLTMKHHRGLQCHQSDPRHRLSGQMRKLRPVEIQRELMTAAAR